MVLFAQRAIAACAAITLAATATAHEFWIQPRSYIVAADDPIRADLMVGENFVGPDYIFVPQGYEIAKLAGPRGERALKFTGRDEPALTLAPLGEGLHRIVLQSRMSKLIHDTAAEFREFAAEVGQQDTIADQVDKRPVAEGYFRHIKSLIAVGSDVGRDKIEGLIHEWVALDPLYSELDSPPRFQLLFRGKASAFAPVQFYARPLEDRGPIPSRRLSTDGDGILVLPDDAEGEIMLNSVRLVPAPVGLDVEWISHWATITFAQ